MEMKKTRSIVFGVRVMFVNEMRKLYYELRNGAAAHINECVNIER